MPPETPPVQAQHFVFLYSGDRRQDCAAVFLILALVALIRFPLLRAFDSAYLGGVFGDAGLYVWLTKSNLRDFLALPWFNTNAFFPYTMTLAWSDNYILPSLATGVFTVLGLPFTAAYNAVLLFAHFLTGATTYLLCRQLTGKPLPALVAGAGFMCWSFFGSHLGHPQLQFAFWLPLSLICLMHFLRFPRVRWAALLGLCFTGAFLCAVYYAVFVVLLTTLVLGTVLLLRPQRFAARHYLRFSSGIILGVLPAIPFVWPYLELLHTFGGRNIYEAYYFSATPLSYLSAPSWNWIWGSTSSWTHSEAQLFPGLTILFLMVFGIRRLWEAKQLAPLKYTLLATLALLVLASFVPGQLARYLCALCSWFAVFVAVLLLRRLAHLEQRMGFAILTNRGLFACIAFPAFILFLITLGPLGNPEKGDFALGVFRLFYEVIPGFSAVRAVSRVGILVVFCLFILSSLSLSYLVDKSKLRTFAVVLPLLLTIAENRIDRFPLESEIPPSPVFDYLASLPQSQEAVLVLPWTEQLKEDGQVKRWAEFARLNVQYMLWGLSLERPLVNGYSGQRSKIMREFPARFRGFPTASSISAIQSIIGLRYIIYASQFDPSFNKEAFFTRLESFKNSLEYVSGDESGNYLLRVVGQVRLGEGYSLLVPSYPSGTVTLELVAPSSGVPGAETVINIFARDHSDIPIASTSVRMDGQPGVFSFAVPPTSDRVRPLRLTFEVQDGLPVFLTEHRYNR